MHLVNLHIVPIFDFILSNQVDSRGFEPTLGPTFRRLGWPDRNRTDQEEQRRRIEMVRNNWLKMVDQLETENRQEIEVLLEEENRRRAQTKPEPNVSNGASQSLCDIPRCLIELTPEQWSNLGPELLRALSRIEGTEQLHQQVDVWRQRFLASRSAMEADRAAWF